MDSLTKKPARKRLSELLVEAGIVKPEELPKGLEYAQKATDTDVEAVAQVKSLIEEQGLSVPTALRALTLSKQKRCGIDQALVELGWRPRKPPEPVAKQEGPIKSSFDPSVLDAIGTGDGPTYATAMHRATWSGIKAKGNTDQLAKSFLKGEQVEIEKSMPPDVVPPSSIPGGANFDKLSVEEDPFNWNSTQSQQYQTAPDWPEGVRAAALDAEPYTSPELGDTRSEDDWVQTSTIAAMPPDFIQAMRTGDLHFSEHRYGEAEQSYIAALNALERTEGAQEVDIADLLVKMGRATLQTSEFHRAEAYLCRALKIREIGLGREDISVAECLDYLAEVYDLQSQYFEAEHYYLGALGIKERVLNPDNSEVSRSLKKLVAVSKRRGVLPEERLSGELLTEAGLIDPSRLDEGLRTAQEHAMPIGRALISLNYLTDEDLHAVLQAQLLLREGIVPAYLAVRALRLASQQRITLEAALREIGLEPDDAGSKAVFDLLRAAQELLDAEKELPPNDPVLAGLCVKIGDVYTDHGQVQQAESLYRRALQIRQMQAEPDKREECEIMGRIGDLQFRQQKYVEAQQIYTRLLDMWEAVVGPDDINFINCLESLAAVQYVNGDYKESGRLYQLAVTGKEKLLGAEHPGVASAIQGRANCYFAIQRYPDAETLYRRAMSMYEKVYGFYNEQVATLLNVLGDLFYTQGDFAKAQVEYSRGLESFSKCTNPDVWAFAGMLEKIAHCFAEAKDYQRADAYYRHFVKTREGFGSFHSADMPDALERYAVVLDNLQRHQEAVAVRQQAAQIRDSLS
jgi:tetratricopeptide (TPR) repeat protein